jgi:hypothetical protein
MVDSVSLNQGAAGIGRGRRKFLGGAGAATLAAMTGIGSIPLMASSADAQAVSLLTDVNILNFALNLEYLEAEFYLRAAFGRGLGQADVTGTGFLGAVSGGARVPFQSVAIRQYAEEIANDEEHHVKFLRSALGSARVARTNINLNTAFTYAARAAGVVPPTGTFNPFQDEASFLLGAFIFEDVGVTAYKGAARFLENKDFLEAAAGLLAVEAYHAGEIRTLLISRGQSDAANKISNLRDAVDGLDDIDQGVTVNGVINVVPTDANGLAFSRNPARVANIVYLGGTSGNFGFFPNRLNGAIR